MARIKIEDLPKEMNITKEDMRKIIGGMTAPLSPELRAAQQEVQQQTLSETAETFKNGADSAKDMWKESLRLLQESSQRQAQVVKLTTI